MNDNVGLMQSRHIFELIFFTYHKYVLVVSWTLEFYPLTAYQSDNDHNIHNHRKYVSWY